MAVRITDLCISCDVCLNECPTGSIVDAKDNPTGENYYYIHPETCTECIGDHDSLACQAACPIDNCIVWDLPYNDENRDYFADLVYKITTNVDNNQPYREEVSMEDRKSGNVECEIN